MHRTFQIAAWFTPTSLIWCSLWKATELSRRQNDSIVMTNRNSQTFRKETVSYAAPMKRTPYWKRTGGELLPTWDSNLQMFGDAFSKVIRLLVISRWRAKEESKDAASGSVSCHLCLTHVSASPISFHHSSLLIDTQIHSRLAHMSASLMLGHMTSFDQWNAVGVFAEAWRRVRQWKLFSFNLVFAKGRSWSK